MTRLRTEWITYMLDGMEDYNRELRLKTGMDLSGLVMHAFGISPEDYLAAQQNVSVAVIPITQGDFPQDTKNVFTRIKLASAKK